MLSKISLLVLVLVLVLPAVLAQSACSFAPDRTTPTGSGLCYCFESQNPKGWIVDCSSKSLTGVPTGLPAETVYLSLNENSITALTSTSLEGLSSLETLQIQNNGLRSDSIEDGAFTHLGNLKSLDLSGNRIILSQAMATHLLPLLRLQTLTLTNNNINVIHSSAVEIFDRLDTLDLTSNAFVCDCDLAWFRNWLLNTGHVGHQITGATCSSPQQYQRNDITTAGFCPSSVCFLCNGGSDAECNTQPSAIQTCSSSQGACSNEIRVSNGVYSIQKSCKQHQACLNQLNANNRDCNTGTENSVCRTCCLGDLCNSPASGVLDGYTLPGFPIDPSLVVQTTTALKTTATESTTASPTIESTNMYTTFNDSIDMITTFSSTPAKSSEKTFIETTTMPTATLKNTQTMDTTLSSNDTTFPPTQTTPSLSPVTTLQNTSTIDTTLSINDTTFPQSPTLSENTTTVLQTTPSPRTTISEALTPVVTRVTPTTEYSLETTLMQTRTPSVSTTPVTPPPSKTTDGFISSTSTQSISSKDSTTSGLASEYVSTVFSTLLSTTQEKTTEVLTANIVTSDLTTQYTSGSSNMNSPISSTYPVTEIAATLTTSSSSSSSSSFSQSKSPSLTTPAGTTTATSPMSILESVEMTSGSVTTSISTHIISSKEATTISSTEPSTTDSAQMFTDTDTLTSRTLTPSQSTTTAITSPILPQTTSSTNAIQTSQITTPVLDSLSPKSLSTTVQLGTTIMLPSETRTQSTLLTQPRTTSSTSPLVTSASFTPELDSTRSTLQSTTSPLSSTTPSISLSPDETLETTLPTTLPTLPETVQTLGNTPTVPHTTSDTSPSRSGTTQTVTKLTSTLDTSTLATAQTSPSIQSTLATTQVTIIPTTLPHISATSLSPSTPQTPEQTTLVGTPTTFHNDSSSTSHTKPMLSAIPSTNSPHSSTISVNPTSAPSNTITRLVIHTSTREPESTSSQYTAQTSTPTYRSTPLNTDTPGTASTPRTASVPSPAPSTAPSSATSEGVSSVTPSASTPSLSSALTMLSTKLMATTESSSLASTQASPVATATSTAQTMSSPSGAASTTPRSYTSTQQPGQSTAGSPPFSTTTGRPPTTDSSIPHCPEETISGEYGKITWLKTPGTETSEVACPYGSNNRQPSVATRLCRMNRGDVTWDEPDTSSCATSTQALRHLAEVPITADNAQTVSKNLTTITSSPMELNETDVNLAVDVLENLVRSINEYDSTEVVENAVDAINNLAGVEMETLVAGQQDAEIATRVLHLIDEFALNVDFEGDMFEAVSERIDVVVVKINTDMINGLSFRSVVDESGTSTPQLSFNNTAPQSTPEAQASLELPGSLFEAHRGEMERVQFVLYKNVIFFEVISETSQMGTTQTAPTASIGDDVIERDALNSLVISASLGNLKITGLRDPVKTSFIHQRPERAENPSCVFWDFQEAGGQGAWSTEGCIASITAEGSTLCECDHLTNFALLMDIYGTTSTFNGDHVMALSIITFAGCTLSILGLIVTFFSYLMIRQLRNDRRTRVLLNLVAALTFMNVLFLTDAVITEFGDPGYIACKLLGALLHYGLLTSIAWMALEAWHMYLALVKVFDSYTSHLMKKMCVIGWGLPAVIVGIVIGVDLDHYDFYNEFCWLNVGGIPFYASFIAPSLAVILFNFIIFALVSSQLCSLRRRSVSASSEQFDVSAQLRASLSITVLLGLTWGLGIFMIGDASLVFSYLFAIFNSFQGFCIFVFHCLLKEEVRLGWRKLFCPQCLTLEELTKSSTGQNFSSSNKQAQLQKRMTIEYQVESNGRHHQSQAMPFNRNHEVPRFNPFAANSEFYQDSSI